MPDEEQTQGEAAQALWKWIPSSWSATSVWVTAFRVFRVSKSAVIDGPKVIDFTNARALVFHGKLKFPDFKHSGIVENDDDTYGLKIDFQPFETPDGRYLVLLTPLSSAVQQENEPLVRARIAYLTGIIAAVGGRNLVYERLTDFKVMPDSATGFSPVFENPGVFPAPDVTDARLVMLASVENAVSNMQPDEKQRAALSLRWFAAAVHELDGIDSFLKYWIALETLAMPETSNIKPINQLLSAAYGIDIAAAQNKFAVGRLSGFRSRMVHHGQLAPVDAALLKYIEALYVDVLFAQLGLTIEHRTASVLADSGFALTNYLHEHS